MDLDKIINKYKNSNIKNSIDLIKDAGIEEKKTTKYQKISLLYIHKFIINIRNNNIINNYELLLRPNNMGYQLLFINKNKLYIYNDDNFIIDIKVKPTFLINKITYKVIKYDICGVINQKRFNSLEQILTFINKDKIFDFLKNDK